MMVCSCFVAIAMLLLLAIAAPAMDVTDARLHVKRGTDTRFELKHYASLDEWEPAAARLRDQILTGCGLNPMPKKTPLRAKVFAKVDRGDYTIETVTFQSYPGLYVIGNLYRPKGKTGLLPVILSPHGHGANGRFEDSGLISIPARCANFAKLGMIAFAYSMIGYNDATQIKHGFHATPRQELWGIGSGALQLWNSIRAVDFVSTLPDVDTSRIGCTGESGGGTQTFMLSAVEPRIAVNAPVCMISATMQGGCVCENAPLIRTDGNSVEIGSLMAPRPMMMVGATGDWTKETRENEYPAIRAVYKLYGAESKLGLFYQHAGHNYDKASREHVYPWFQRLFLGENVGDMTPEQPHDIGDTKALMAFTKPPKDALSVDQLTDELIRMHEAQIDGFGLGSRSSLDRFQRAFGSALKCCFGTSVPKAGDIAVDERGSEDLANCTVKKLVIGRKGVGDAIPALLFVPKAAAKAAPVLVVHGSGKAALLANGAPGELISSLLARGGAVLAIDTFLTGDTDKQDERLKEKFFTTFYRTDTAERVQDIVTALAYLNAGGKAKVDLIGIGNSGIDCLFARAFSGVAGSTVIDANGFDSSDEAFAEHYFVPSIRRVGDIRTAAAMVAPGRLVIGNTAKGFPVDWIKRAYAACGATDSIEVTATAVTEKQMGAKL